MPRQKPGLSKQDYATPKIFIDAVKRRFNIREFAYDLAASLENTKAKYFFCEEQDSLKQDWTKLKSPMWLNPPYSNIAPWAEKCERTTWVNPHTRQIYFLVPASVGANWWAQHVDKRALVLLLNGRISFDGIGPYPKDCALICYGVAPGYAVWRWKDQK